MQQLPDIEMTHPKEQFFCLETTIYIGSRKMCVNFQTDTDKFKHCLVRYRKPEYPDKASTHIELH